MSATVINVTTEELRSMVENLVEEKLISLFGDPEDGMEIRNELKERLLRQRSEMSEGETGRSFEDVMSKLGLGE